MPPKRSWRATTRGADIRTAWRRWRGAGGEIDLIAEDGEGLIFIEVKKARSHAQAAERLSRRQIDRIHASAAEYLGRMPLGQLTDCRFDVALVDEGGRVEIIENADALTRTLPPARRCAM